MKRSMNICSYLLQGINENQRKTNIMNNTIYHKILKIKESGKKLFALLIDPDKSNRKQAAQLALKAQNCKVDLIFVGSSLLTNGSIQNCITSIKENCSVPVVLFPGNALQINKSADAILFLSLISGRNPDLLIGNHVIAAPVLKESKLEVLPTGYMLIESGKLTTAVYMSNTVPIPSDKNDIAAFTAYAGELLGLKLIYMDGGSGALNAVPASMISTVSSTISIPLIVGGGIKTPAKAAQCCKAGADIIVTGNAIEKDLTLIHKLCEAVHAV